MCMLCAADVVNQVAKSDTPWGALLRDIGEHPALDAERALEQEIQVAHVLLARNKTILSKATPELWSRCRMAAADAYTAVDYLVPLHIIGDET